MTKREIHPNDLVAFNRLDMTYNKIRVLQAKHNETEFRCLNSGKCCNVGLKIHLAECAYIAFRMRQEYYLRMENEGQESADAWMNTRVEALTDRMYDKSWDPDTQSTDLQCAFWEDGCTIYGYRPMVCRAYGTVTEVDDFCPRRRNDYNTIEHFAGKSVEDTVQEFQLILKRYAEDNDKSDDYDVVVYMPLGVLSFLLEDVQMHELYEQTNEKMWLGDKGWFNYQSRFTRLHGLKDEFIEAEAKLRGLSVNSEGSLQREDSVNE
jgi:Fe-S-cluster containining protein